MGRFSVRSSVRTYVPPLGHPARPEAQPARPEAQLASQPASQPQASGMAGWASGLAGWPRGGDGRTNERTNGKSPHSTGLRPLLGPLPKKSVIRDFAVRLILDVQKNSFWSNPKI